ncbi:hypothetical protein WNZ14_11930 [Hoeflea sp. AS60]|uniref:hypothetical protein n=1 Tax=Hoeflea sp. AS60 TaxID=3135780 RepID=UPI00316E3F31
MLSFEVFSEEVLHALIGRVPEDHLARVFFENHALIQEPYPVTPITETRISHFVAWQFTMDQTDNINPDYKQDL